MKNYIIAYCSNAYAIENGSVDMQEEEKRKVRISAGGVQSIWRLRPLLNPIKYGIFSFQYISHRVLRWSITPILFFLLLPLNMVIFLLNHQIFYIILFILQVLFYSAGFFGYYLSKKKIKNKLLFIPYYFLFMNLNVLKGFIYLVKRKNNTGAWAKSKRA